MSLSKVLWTVGSLVSAQLAVKVVRGFEADALLGLIGLQRRRSPLQMIVPAIGLASLGAALGAGAALLIKPTPGAALRPRLSVRADKLADEIGVSHKTDELSSTAAHERNREPSGRFRAEKDSS